MPVSEARYVLPEFTEHASRGVHTFDPYSKLLSERVVLLGAPVDDTSANDVMAQLIQLEHDAPDQDIQLYINSPGGSITAMAAVYDTMQFIRCDIQTVCLGQAASAAAVLLAAGTPGKRMALPNSRILIHQPALPEPVRGMPSDLAVQAAEIERQRHWLARTLARHTGQPLERVAADIERDAFFDGPAAARYGLVDRLTGSRKDAPTPPAG